MFGAHQSFTNQKRLCSKLLQFLQISRATDRALGDGNFPRRNPSDQRTRKVETRLERREVAGIHSDDRRPIFKQHRKFLFRMGFAEDIESERMRKCVQPPEFRDGVSGQSLLIGGKAGKQQRTYESSAQNIFDFKKGTVSLWVKPIDWNGLPTRYFHMIFRAVSAGKSNTQMLIYKYFNSENLLFLLGPMTNSHFTTLNNPVRHWQPGQWHHLAAVWNGSDLAFYLDGQLYGTQKMRFPVSGNVPCASIALGPKGWDNTDGETLVDELKIFSRPLAPPEITALYKEHAAAVSNHDNFITLRNRPGKDRYTFSCCGLRDRNGAFTEPDTQWRIGSDGKNLFVKINTRKPCEILLYSDGVLSRHAMPGENECVIPLQGRDLRFNVVCGENNLAPVSGFPEDAANFYYLRFADDVPVVSIKKLYAGDVFEMEPEVISSPNGKNVQRIFTTSI